MWGARGRTLTFLTCLCFFNLLKSEQQRASLWADLNKVGGRGKAAEVVCPAAMLIIFNQEVTMDGFRLSCFMFSKTSLKSQKHENRKRTHLRENSTSLHGY